MKHYLYFLLIAFFTISTNSNVFAVVSLKKSETTAFSNKKNNTLKSMVTKPKTQTKMDIKKWLPLGLGVVGLAFIFLPYLSIIGLIAGIAAVVTGFLFRKEYPKTARWGILLGGICVVAFLAVLGLVLFF